MQIVENIGKRLQMLRKLNNKSQSEIANVLNTTQQQYWKYEKNKQDLPIRHLITLADYYKITTDNLLGIDSGFKIMQSVEERELIKLYRDLTEREKGRILERIIMLLQSTDIIYGGIDKNTLKGSEKND